MYMQKYALHNDITRMLSCITTYIIMKTDAPVSNIRGKKTVKKCKNSVKNSSGERLICLKNSQIGIQYMYELITCLSSL